MKKLALAAILALSFATPAIACPHEEGKAQEKTAEKKADDTSKAADSAKKATPKPATAPKAPAAPKTADSGKVSQK